MLPKWGTISFVDYRGDVSFGRVRWCNLADDAVPEKATVLERLGVPTFALGTRLLVSGPQNRADASNFSLGFFGYVKDSVIYVHNAVLKESDLPVPVTVLRKALLNVPALGPESILPPEKRIPTLPP